MAKKKKKLGLRKKFDWKYVLMGISGVFIGIVLAYFFISVINLSINNWHTGWECFAWNTTEGILVTGQGQYVSTENGSMFLTWEELGYDRTYCVKYYYVKQKWEINNTL